MKRFIALLITSLSLTGIVCISCGNDNLHPTPEQSPIAPKADGVFRIMTYNVGAINKFVSDSFTKENNLNMLAAIVREAEADAVCFQELDSCNKRNDYFQLERLTQAIDKNWSYHYAPAIKYRDGKYGTGAAAKDSPVKCFDIFIPTREGSEDRAVAVMEFEKYVICSTHLNYGQTDQVELINDTITKLYADSDKAVFLGGDMNAQPGSEMMLEFEKCWDIISTVAERSVQSRMVCIDYILQFKNQAQKVEVVNSHAILQAQSGDMKVASDHYPIYVDVRLQ